MPGVKNPMCHVFPRIGKHHWHKDVEDDDNNGNPYDEINDDDDEELMDDDSSSENIDYTEDSVLKGDPFVYT